MRPDDRIYRVNVKRLALLALPTWLRRPIVGALIYAGVSPLGRLLQDLRACRDATSYRLGHNGQVCKLRGALNDLFDPVMRRIVIEDARADESTYPTHIWMRDAGRWLLVRERAGGVTIIGGRGFAGSGGHDFVVVLPVDLAIDESRLRAVVNAYKLASMRFAIVYRN